MSSTLFHLAWASLCVWAMSPAWIMQAGRPAISEGYTVLLPAAILATTFAQWAVGGSSFSLGLRATPWLLLALVYGTVQLQAGPWLKAMLGLVALLGGLHLAGVAVAIRKVGRRAGY